MKISKTRGPLFLIWNWQSLSPPGIFLIISWVKLHPRGKLSSFDHPLGNNLWLGQFFTFFSKYFRWRHYRFEEVPPSRLISIQCHCHDWDYREMLYETKDQQNKSSDLSNTRKSSYWEFHCNNATNKAALLSFEDFTLKL